MPWIFAAAIAVVAAVYGIYEIVDYLKGNTIVLFGPKAAGKTTLIEFLKNGSISEEYEPSQTMHAYKTKGKELKIKDLDLSIKELYDVPGSSYGDLNYTEGYMLLEKDKYDFLFYVFDGKRVYDGDKGYIQIIEKDAQHIKKHVKSKKIVLIATHEDLLYNSLNTNKREEYSKKILQKLQYLTTILNKNNNKWGLALGSLKQEGNRIGEFVRRIFDIAVELKEKKDEE